MDCSYWAVICGVFCVEGIISYGSCTACAGCTANKDEDEEGLGWSTPLSILWAC